ncbi:putative coiled-coil domain-containing protein 16 [Trichinella spiralis]|uniref:putative coiled-coil domain-containing protein 16 n=1 Tax=Trichinella spiralis TaxID=6334 RepID=UPI0001EFE7AA|nr:putative coiled-coil domain-containing protein 16 [Trichinella spiralis]
MSFCQSYIYRTEMPFSTDSPYAKYGAAGVLHCTLCNTRVRNVKCWVAHVRGLQHRNNLIARKAAQEKAAAEKASGSGLVPEKRKADEASGCEVSTKIAKGNSYATQPEMEGYKLPEDFFDKNDGDQQSTVAEVDDESDDSVVGEEMDQETSKLNSNTETELPEGFFDDPNKDAEVRKVDVRNTVEEEWQRFQKEMKLEEQISSAINEEEYEALVFERSVEEADEEIYGWARVNMLEKKVQSKKKEALIPRAESNSWSSAISQADEEEQDIEESTKRRS